MIERLSKIIIDTCYRGKRAVGVEYVKDTVIHPDVDQNINIVKATKLVVVSAGAFGSPQILERSGIGAKEVLERNGIEQIADLPGVGEKYQGRLSRLYKKISLIL